MNAAAVSAVAEAQAQGADPATLAPNPIVPAHGPIALSSTQQQQQQQQQQPPAPGDDVFEEHHQHQHVVTLGAPEQQPPTGITPATHPHPHINTTTMPKRVPQRLVICCDGTWQARDTVKSVLQGAVFTSQDDAWLTNIAVLASAIAPDAGHPNEDGIIIRQNVLYLSGVGTTLSTLQNLYEGATGASLADKVEEGYSWLCDCYSDGDEIFLFGFSRGAYTARCIGAFINWAGILKKSELIWFRSIWEAYQKRRPDEPKTLEEAAETLRRYTGRYPSRDASQTSSDAIKEGIAIEQTPDSAVQRVKAKVSWAKAPPIQVLGVFDTVGSLGIPNNYMDPAIMKLFSFLDPSLGSNVRNAFHALALAEERKNYLPTFFFQDPKEIRDEWPRQVLRQVWFGGEHSDVGGGWVNHGSSDIALAWMVGQIMDTYDKPLLNIDLDVIRSLQDRRVAWAKQPDHVSRGTLESQAIRQVHHQFTKELDRTTWANDCHVGFRHERLHHSVVASGKYDPATSPMFKELRERDPARLDKIWKAAADPASMTRTEHALRWDAAEEGQTPPLAGQSGARSARGSAGNGGFMAIPGLGTSSAGAGADAAVTLPFAKPIEEAKHDASSTAQEPKSFSERIKLGVDVVENSISDTLKSVALIPDAIKDTLQGKSHHHEQKDA
ncbi:hypothetical protein OC834_000558 [Tilletia horrida]|nr:hypothetical protein OC834_000558 [Tilletia horrida]